MTVGARAFNTNEDEPEPEEQITILLDQLKAFTDQPDGSISGKGRGDEDDAAMGPFGSTSLRLNRRPKLTPGPARTRSSSACIIVEH